jgi:hypothetical protein
MSDGVNESSMTDQQIAVKELVGVKHPFPVVAVAMNKEQLIETLKSTESIYNTPEVLSWLTDDVFEFNDIIDDDYVSRIEKRFDEIQDQFISANYESLVNELG